MKEEWKRSMMNRYMILAIAVILLILGNAYAAYSSSWKKEDVLTLIANPMALSGLTPFAAIFPMLPCGFQFVEDYNSGFIRFQLVRLGRRSYVRRRILVTAVTGGSVMAVAFGCLFLIALIQGNPVQSSFDADFYRGGTWWPIVSVWGGKLVLLLKLLLAFEFGAVWSSVCLLVSVVFTNRYIAFMGTFAVYQIFWYLLRASRLNPVYLLRGDVGGYTGAHEPILLQGLVLALLSTALLYGMERKLKHV